MVYGAFDKGTLAFEWHLYRDVVTVRDVVAAKHEKPPACLRECDDALNVVVPRWGTSTPRH